MKEKKEIKQKIVDANIEALNFLHKCRVKRGFLVQILGVEEEKISVIISGRGMDLRLSDLLEAFFNIKCFIFNEFGVQITAITSISDYDIEVAIILRNLLNKKKEKGCELKDCSECYDKSCDFSRYGELPSCFVPLSEYDEEECSSCDEEESECPVFGRENCKHLQANLAEEDEETSFEDAPDSFEMLMNDIISEIKNNSYCDCCPKSDCDRKHCSPKAMKEAIINMIDPRKKGYDIKVELIYHDVEAEDLSEAIEKILSEVSASLPDDHTCVMSASPLEE